MRKLFTLITTVVLILGAVFPAYASKSVDVSQLQSLSHLSNSEKQTIVNHLSRFDINTASNNNEISKKNKEIIFKAMADEKNLYYADINKENTVIILNTEHSNTQVAITDDIVEVIEQVDVNTFLINDEKHHFEVTFTPVVSNQALTADVELQSSDGWVQVSSRQGPWTWQSASWVNVNAERNFHTYTAGAFGSIMGYYLAIGLVLTPGGALVAGIALSAAYAYVASTNYPTNVGKSYVSFHRNGTSSFADKRVWSSDYAIYNGKDIYLGLAETFYYRCIACYVH